MISSKKNQDITADIPFDPDLAKVFLQRSDLKITQILNTASSYDFRISKEDVSVFTQNILDVILFPALKDEIERYREKRRNRKHDYKEDIDRARSGNDQSLSRLIEWDKGWLFIDWVKNRILMAQENHDNNFLEIVGEALRAEPGVAKPIEAEGGKKEREKRRLIVAIVQIFLLDYLTKNPSESKQKAFNRITKAFFDGIEVESKNWPVQEADKNFYTKLGYFRQYIRRRIKL